MAWPTLRCATVCCYKLLLVLLLMNAALANGTGSASAQENNNYSSALGERAKRNVEDMQQMGPQTPAATLVPTDGADSSRSQHEYSVDDKDMHNLPPNIGAYKPLNIVKRAPNGFIGMRGKKENEFTDFTDVNTAGNTLNWNEIDPLQLAQLENDYNDGYDWTRYKKAPSAFYGVRGKKYTADFNHLNSVLYRLEENRLREAMLEDFLNSLAAKSVNQNEISKRAPTGFTGMRGKRPALELYDDADDLAAEKRGPANAFVGVRGKKDVDHQNFKRSPTEPYNRRSKNQRFVDFSNKFVAVRGKKGDAAASSNAVSADLAHEAQHLMQTATGADVGAAAAAAARERFYVNMQLLPLLGIRAKRAAVLDGSQAAVNDLPY